MVMRFVPNPAFPAQIRRSPLLRPLLEAGAESVAERAREIARAEAYDEGDYHDGIEAVVIETDEGLVGRVNANDWKSHLIEFGTVDTPAFAPLRRALEAEIGNVEGA